jgi:hypothetical protein
MACIGDGEGCMARPTSAWRLPIVRGVDIGPSGVSVFLSDVFARFIPTRNPTLSRRITVALALLWSLSSPMSAADP